MEGQLGAQVLTEWDNPLTDSHIEEIHKYDMFSSQNQRLIIDWTTLQLFWFHK